MRLLLVLAGTLLLILLGGCTSSPSGVVVTATPAPTSDRSPTVTPTVGSTPTYEQMIQGAMASVVRIVAGDSVGTGFVFRVEEETAYIATNEHVVTGIQEVEVYREDEEFVGYVLGTDEVQDIAVVSVASGSFSPIDFQHRLPEIGAEVVSIGYALDFPGEPSVTRGIVSGHRNWAASGLNIIQTDAALNPGNSGGPLLNRMGEVVGMNTSEIPSAENVGFAIVSEAVEMRATALAQGDSRVVQGRRFVRRAGPVNLTSKENDTTITWVLGGDFLVEAEIPKLHDFWLVQSRGEQLWHDAGGPSAERIRHGRIWFNLLDR